MGVIAVRRAESCAEHEVGSRDLGATVPDAPASPAHRTNHAPLVPQTVRGRMVALFLLLLLASGVLSIVGTRMVLVARVNERVEEALRQEIAEVQLLMTAGRDPLTGEHFTSLARALDVYFERNVPSLHEAHVAFVGDALYQSRLRSFPVSTLPDDVLAEWAQFSADGSSLVSGEYGTVEGLARFQSVDIAVAGERGAFIVTILPASEMREIRELQTYGAMVVGIVVMLAAACAWKLSGRILAPVREVTETARSISETDRRGRVSEAGGVEAAEMARHFNAMLDRLDAVHYSQLAFVQAVGHELRTPLTVATGHLELLDEDDPERLLTVQLVLSELSRMARLVDDLQTLAEAERDDYVVLADVDRQSFAEELMAKSTVLGRRQWRLVTAGSGSFRGDRERLTEAMLNLVDNAVKHTAVDDEIELGVVSRGHQVRMWVRDTGPGLEAGIEADLFERFVRGPSAHARYRGSGLGLAIARLIARAHEGEVTVESSSAGACFVVAFPAGGS